MTGLLNTLLCQTLTYSSRVTHICVSNLTIIGSDNGLSPGRRQAIIWTNAVILLTGRLGTNKLQWNVNRNSYIFIQENLFENIVWKMAAILTRPQCDIIRKIKLNLSLPLLVTYTYGTPTFSSICQQLSQHLTVLGHQQAFPDTGIRYAIFISIISVF